MLSPEQVVEVLESVFDIPADWHRGASLDGPFPDWQLIAHALERVVERGAYKVVGICGSQGSGKSTLAEICVEVLSRGGLKAAAVSIDDFYLTKAERERLARAVHPMCATRGVPGTHDTGWLDTVLRGIALHQPRQAPRFDKGLDDRVGEWTLDADLLILEGWCVGVTREPEARLTNPCNDLERIEDGDGTWRRWVNRAISAYEPLWETIDFWIRLKPPSFEQVFEWRLQQEQSIEPERRMDEAAIRRFVQHYERLTRWQWACPPPRPGLGIELDSDHSAAEALGYA